MIVLQIDELEIRLTEVKLELFNNYKKTVKKISDVQNEEEYNDHDYIENTESQDADGEIGYVQKVTNYVKTKTNYVDVCVSTYCDI